MLGEVIHGYRMGHFDEAQAALHAVLASSPPEAIALKAKKLLDRIDQEARRQGITLHPSGSGSR